MTTKTIGEDNENMAFCDRCISHCGSPSALATTVITYRITALTPHSQTSPVIASGLFTPYSIKAF